jgi:hypothetical protein
MTFGWEAFSAFICGSVVEVIALDPFASNTGISGARSRHFRLPDDPAQYIPRRHPAEDERVLSALIGNP